MMKFLDAARLFEEAWKVFRKYYGQQLDEKNWEQLVADVDMVYARHQDLFARDMLAAIINEFERMDKRRM